MQFKDDVLIEQQPVDQFDINGLIDTTEGLEINPQEVGAYMMRIT